MDISKVGDKTKIGEAQIASTQSAKTRAVQTDKTDTSKSIASVQDLGSSAEKVRWSDDADVAAEGVAAAKDAPSVRSEKIAQLKAAIKDGSYNMDSSKIAEKMIQRSLEEDLLTRKA